MNAIRAEVAGVKTRQRILAGKGSQITSPFFYGANGDFMWRVLIKLLVACACVSTLWAQDFKLFNYDVQVHGFASQGFVHTDGNNWLTMDSGNVGSGQFTDFGGNASVQITDKLRIGAQIYTVTSASWESGILNWTGP